MNVSKRIGNCAKFAGAAIFIVLAHRTFRFYNIEPTYDAAKMDVIAILDGKMKEQSSSRHP